ncbi:hypothetical protein [Thermorudis peleae]|uniref:hypothetical protein n=1 Tax=Thermorudis peleae TaxID=1382356 RepID=UPI00056EA16A|nr:hypothetical protein [Thermorudis peleae]
MTEYRAHEQPLLTSLLGEAASWTLESDLLHFDGHTAVVRVTLRLDLQTVSALGSASTDEGAPPVEQAEDRALTRLLARLGRASIPAEPARPALAGTFSPSGIDDLLTPAPPEPPPPPPLETVQPPFTASSLSEELPVSVVSPTPPAGQPLAKNAAAQTAGRSRSIRQTEWDSFWRWARSMGIRSRPEIEELLGQSIEGLSPREVRTALEAKLAQRHAGTSQGTSLR